MTHYCHHYYHHHHHHRGRNIFIFSLILFNHNRLSGWCLLIERTFTKELMRIFLLVCETDSLTPDLDTFFHWLKRIENRTLIYIFKLIWGHLFPIEIYRKANSRGNVYFLFGSDIVLTLFYFLFSYMMANSGP